MPHQCTNCDRTFADGSKEMLSGCPECGGTKFQFRPDGFDGGGESTPASTETESTAPDSGTTAPDPGPESEPEPPERPGDAMTRTVGSAAATVKDLVSGRVTPDATEATAPAADSDLTASDPASPASKSTSSASEPATQSGDGSDDDIIVAESSAPEDTAQADARTQLVEPDDVSDGFDPTVDDSPDPDAETVSSDPDGVAAEDGDAVDSGESSGATDTGESSGATDTGEPGGAVGSGETDAEADSDDSGTDAASGDRTVAAQPDAERAERPDLAELREELNEQFESIRVVEPGQYELNLMELYDREEYIIALQEDGRYSIQMPETWREADA